MLHTHDNPIPPQAPGVAPDAPPLPQGAAETDAAHDEGSFFGDLLGMLSDRVHLFSLEMQQAGRALAQMVALTMLAVAFGATAWVAMWAWLADTLLDAGLRGIWVMLIVVGLNLLAAGLAVMRALSRANLIGLPATVRQLTRAHKHDEVADGKSAHRTVPHAAADTTAHAAAAAAAHAASGAAAHAAPDAASHAAHPASKRVH